MASTRAFILLQQCLPLLWVVAFVAGALWTGILFSVSWLSGRARWMADGTDVGTLALSLNRRWATPSLVVCLVSASLWVWARPAGALDVASMWGLGVALVVLLLLHSSVEVRALRVSRGSVSATHGEGVRRLMLVLSLAALLTLVGMRIAWS
jgi:hypothetical protein